MLRLGIGFFLRRTNLVSVAMCGIICVGQFGFQQVS